MRSTKSQSPFKPSIFWDIGFALTEFLAIDSQVPLLLVIAAI
jgi:hypothetical protein